MSTFIKGEDLILSVWTGAAYLPIACLTSNSINIAKSIIETSTKCDPGVVVRASGTKSYEIPFEGIFIDTTSSVAGDLTKVSHDSLLALFDTDDEQDWRMDTGLADNPYYFGAGIFAQLDMTAGSGDEFVTFSGSISGSGAIPSTTDLQHP
jgi:predicted secreted protein